LRGANLILKGKDVAQIAVVAFSPNMVTHCRPRSRNPIEQGFSKLKALLLKAAERSIPALWDRIGAILDTFLAAEALSRMGPTVLWRELMFDLVCGQWHRTPAHQALPPLDQRPARTDEPQAQGGDRQALPLRNAHPAQEHVHAFLMAYNFAKRLKSLRGLTAYEYICKIWTKQPKKFRLNPLHHTVGLNT
jgi:hypothetical protein